MWQMPVCTHPVDDRRHMTMRARTRTGIRQFYSCISEGFACTASQSYQSWSSSPSPERADRFLRGWDVAKVGRRAFLAKDVGVRDKTLARSRGPRPRDAQHCQRHVTRGGRMEAWLSTKLWPLLERRLHADALSRFGTDRHQVQVALSACFRPRRLQACGHSTPWSHLLF